jgi:hypothetical protein
VGLWFEELDWSSTPIGEVSLRRRTDGDVDVFEVKLGDEFLRGSADRCVSVTKGRHELW